MGPRGGGPGDDHGGHGEGGEEAAHGPILAERILARMRADRFAPLSPEKREPRERFGPWEDATYFSQVVGLVLDEVRTDYCRVRLPSRPGLSPGISRLLRTQNSLPSGSASTTKLSSPV